MITGIITILAVAAILAMYIISIINGFKRKEIKVDEALSGIEVALTKRYDLLTKLFDTCKGYLKHEKDVFSEIVNLRKGMGINEMNTANTQMESIRTSLFAVAENYPELRSSDVVVELENGIQDAEEHLQAARRLYNANVTVYNTAIAIFPASLLANGRTAKEFFRAEEHKKEDVKISF